MSANREKLINRYINKLKELQEEEKKYNNLTQQLNVLRAKFKESENAYYSLQSVGQIVGEILRPLDDDRYIVKTVSGTRYVVGVRTRIDHSLLTNGRRVALDIATHTIMHALPREVDPAVYHMSTEDPSNVKYSYIGGLAEQLN